MKNRRQCCSLEKQALRSGQRRPKMKQWQLQCSKLMMLLLLPVVAVFSSFAQMICQQENHQQQHQQRQTSVTPKSVVQITNSGRGNAVLLWTITFRETQPVCIQVTELTNQRARWHEPWRMWISAVFESFWVCVVFWKKTQTRSCFNGQTRKRELMLAWIRPQHW